MGTDDGAQAPLLPAPLIIAGHLVTLDDDQPEIPDGALYIDRSGTIVAVAPASAKAPDGFEQANRVEADGVVYPGLIDLHNHIAYNVLPLWIAPDRTEPWTARDQWPRDKDYKPSISLPVNALCKASGKAVLKYVETKAVIGGVTSIQGSAKVARPFEGWMVRNIEFETFRTGRASVNQSVRAFTSEEQYEDAKRHLAENHAYIYHLAEGTDPKLIADYDGLDEHGCLAPKFIGIHSTALHDPQYADWQPQGGSIVWSPFSNLWLYGATTDVPAARRNGMRICLGADWSPSGSKNLLGELKVADLYNREDLGGLFSDAELCAMATCNPADALGWSDRIGRLRAGAHADVLIVARREDDVYRNLITSIEEDVRLVTVNGYPMYGIEELMLEAAAVNPEPIDVGALLGRAITLRDERFEDADMSWPEVVEALRLARDDPPAAHDEAIARSGAERHLRLLPDKPWDNPEELGPDVALVDVDVGELDSLTHDAAYFAAIDRQTLHGGKLAGLRAYYERGG